MSSTQKRVRVVESNPARARVMSDWLSGAFEIAVSTAGVGALGAVDTDTDAVVVPERLANMRAGELLEGLRADGADCRVVLLSDGGVVAEYEGGGFDRVLEWPLDAGELLSAVSAVVSGPHKASASVRSTV
jgi:CheY-like chemotaxis protein